jgi:hypothetical protein
MGNNRGKSWFFGAGFWLALSTAVFGRTFYVDAEAKNDRDGSSPNDAWNSLTQVNRAKLMPGDRILFKRGHTWRGQLIPQSGNTTGVITYGAFGEGPKPTILGSASASRAEDWEPAGIAIWATTAALDVDVGNIIFDHGVATGVKKWKEADLRNDGDYFYDPSTRRVKLRFAINPAKKFKNIELALRRHIIDQSNRNYAAYENLDLRYGAAHGIGGGSTHHITVRNCDLSYIGGGHQMTRADGVPVRFGNGIEFWSGAKNCLVEGCRIWEIYDAALTNQGDGTNVQENITYRRNIIWNSEYSFEYWNRGPSSLTRNIVFEHNICVDAGYGWGYRQRPDPNGRHLMFYDNSAMTTNIVIRYNIFCRAKDSLMRLHGRDWTAALSMDYNCWHQPQGPLILWGQNKIFEDKFKSFMQEKGFESHGVVDDPKFVDAEHRDYQLSNNSPVKDWFQP